MDYHVQLVYLKMLHVHYHIVNLLLVLPIVDLIILFFLAVFYAVTVVPVGMFIYTTKSNHGINIFSKTGYHAYAQCLRNEVRKIKILEKNQQNALEKKQDN